MGLLLYKSNEMFSATELIRKSKMIFDKIVDDEIDKAIILRDGKPCFMLMDFEKYEKIMAEYEQLKKNNSSKKKSTKHKAELSEYQENAQIPKPKKTSELTIAKSKPIQSNPEPEIVSPSKPKNIVDTTAKQMEQEKNLSEIEKKVLEENKQIDQEQLEPVKKEPDNIKQEIPIQDTNSMQEEELQTQDEINIALDKIKHMNLNEDERKKVEEKIRLKIEQARKERESLTKKQSQLEKEDLKEELKLQVKLKEKNKKKERELKEFWD